MWKKHYPSLEAAERAVTRATEACGDAFFMRVPDDSTAWSVGQAADGYWVIFSDEVTEAAIAYAWPVRIFLTHLVESGGVSSAYAVLDRLGWRTLADLKPLVVHCLAQGWIARGESEQAICISSAGVLALRPKRKVV